MLASVNEGRVLTRPSFLSLSSTAFLMAFRGVRFDAEHSWWLPGHSASGLEPFASEKRCASPIAELDEHIEEREQFCTETL